MKAYVITIIDLDKSVESANRCIQSAIGHLDVDVTIFKATTPMDNPESIFKQKKYPIHLFDSTISRKDAAMAAFLSHASLWEQCSKDSVDYLIFEHDAIVVRDIPYIQHNGCISLGRPSFGRYDVPKVKGVGPLVSKQYFGGAHAYLVSPKAASMLLTEAKRSAKPVDVFLHLSTFPWLEEYFPWPVLANDSFTTIQKEKGCTSKHNWNSKYDLMEGWLSG